MFKRLREIANAPKKPASQKTLAKALMWMAMIQMFALIVVIFWPARAMALGPLLFLVLGGIVSLWLEAKEGLIGAPDISPETNSK